jgi:peptidoglycan/xylan/chitin deacetylase (PgdA/CDA1 family)
VFHNRIPVLAFHAVDDKLNDKYNFLPELFKELIRKLSENFRFITANRACQIWEQNKKFDHSLLMLTFDDGYAGLMDLVPFFEELKVKFTVFISSSHIGKNNSWDNGAFSDRTHLSYNDLSILSTHGHEIASHCLNHFRLSRMNNEDLIAEFCQSKTDLESNLGIQIFAVAYPFGSADDRIAGMAKDYYKIGFTTTEGYPDWEVNQLLIRRITVNSFDNYYSILTQIDDYMKVAPTSQPVCKLIGS